MGHPRAPVAPARGEAATRVRTGLDRVAGGEPIPGGAAAPWALLTTGSLPLEAALAALEPAFGAPPAWIATTPPTAAPEATASAPLALDAPDARLPAEHWRGLATLVVDVQFTGWRDDPALRLLAGALEDAARAGVRVVVLDRPDPMGGLVAEGRLPDEARTRPPGAPLPMVERHGMTSGEIARLFNGPYGIEARLDVVAMAGWSRTMTWEKAGLAWVPLWGGLGAPGDAWFAGLRRAAASVGWSVASPGGSTVLRLAAPPDTDVAALREALARLAGANTSGAAFEAAGFAWTWAAGDQGSSVLDVTWRGSVRAEPARAARLFAAAVVAAGGRLSVDELGSWIEDEATRAALLSGLPDAPATAIAPPRAEALRRWLLARQSVLLVRR